jgi:acyl-CoA dehydrogenase
MVLTLPSRRSIFAGDHEAFRDSVRRFVTAEITPHLADWRRTDGAPRSLTAAAGEAGFLGTTVPEEFGGGGTDDLGFLAVLIEETIAAGATGIALTWALHAGAAIPCLVEHGTAADKQRWLPGLAAGELCGIPAARGSVKVQDGRLTGVLSCVPGPQLADLLLVDVGDELPGIAVIPIDQPGVAIKPVVANLAGNDAALADVSLAGVAMDAVLACAGAFRRDLDLWLSVLAVAGARTAITLALEYVRNRKVFGRPLAEFENTRFRLAELSSELAMATTHVDQCLTARIDGGLQTVDAAAARLTTEGLHNRAVDQGLQLHGGYGYIREYPIAQAFADARFLRLAGRAQSDARHAVASGLRL